MQVLHTMESRITSSVLCVQNEEELSREEDTSPLFFSVGERCNYFRYNLALRRLQEREHLGGRKLQSL